MTWHVEHGTFPSPHHPKICYDSAWSATLDSGVAVLAVADGVGTTERAGRASRQAVDACREALLADEGLFRHDAGAEAWQPAAGLMQATVERFASELDLNLAQSEEGYETTMAVVVCCDDWIFYSIIGDVFVVMVDEATAQLLALGARPQEGGRTATYTLRDYPEFAQVGTAWLPTARAVLASTDGLERLHTYTPVATLDGAVAQRAVGVNRYVTEALRHGLEGESIVEPFGVPEVMGLKGDDVGIAVAFR